VGAKTLLMLPLISEERAIGLVELVDKQNFRTFTQEEIELLKILSAHAAKAMKNAQIYESEQNQRRLAEALAEAAKSLNTSLDLDAVLDTILEQTIVVMQCESAHLMMVRGELAQVVGHRGYEMHPGALANIGSLALPANIAAFEAMRVSRKPILIPDTQTYKGWVNVEGYDWVRSFASSPLFIGNDLIGFLNLDSEIPGFFKESILPGLEALASHAAIALNNAQLYQDIEQRASELEAVRQASLTVTSSLDLDHLLNLILQQSFKLNPGLVSGHIFLYQDGKLSFGAAIQLDGSTGKPFAEPREDGLTYTVARTGEMIVVGDMQNHPLFRNMPPDWTGSIVGIPIKYGKRVVGVMNIAHPQTYYFHPPQVRMLKLLSDQAAISIVNARLHNVVEEQSRTDPLTRLNNRRAFDQRLGEETQRSERFSRTFTLAMMDLDGFKKINDTFGHPVGDKLLIEISKNLQRNVRNTDFLARFGGDEFALIMPETPLDIAARISRRIQASILQTDLSILGDAGIPISLSVGLAEFPANGVTPEELVKSADTDLYKTKKKGRGG
jgi:diguanylate cyclase (GGDEF)-like protein